MEEVEFKSFYRKQIEGGKVTLDSLKSKGDEIRQRLELLLKQAEEEEGEKDENVDAEFEDEDVRGFTNGGASNEEEDSKEDLEEQLKILEKQEKLVQTQQALNEMFDQALKEQMLEQDNEKGDGIFNYESIEDAKNRAAIIKSQYDALGIACDVTIAGNVVTVTAYMPENLKDSNPLSMSASELQEIENSEEEEKEIPGKSPKQPIVGKWTGMVVRNREQQKQKGEQEGGGVNLPS